MKNGKPFQMAAILDDDDFYVFALERMLNIFNIAESVHSFPNGNEALEYFTKFKSSPEQLPDVIFLDINMPEMNGWQFLENFRKIRPQLKKEVSIYMLSSSISLSDFQLANSYTEVSDYLVKPVTKADLLRVLEEVQSAKADAVERTR